MKLQKMDIEILIEKYSHLITDEIINADPRGCAAMLRQCKSKFLNSEFENEKKENTALIEEGVLYFKNNVLDKLDRSKRNNTYILENDPIFLEELHYYKEYKKLLNGFPGDNFSFTNNFDKSEPNKVYEYFYKLVEKGYLSKEDLENYLILAFEVRTPPSEKITFSNKHIGNIKAIFYKYYADADSTHGKQKKYAELLGEYFKGFTTKKVINNFAKSK